MCDCGRVELGHWCDHSRLDLTMRVTVTDLIRVAFDTRKVELACDRVDLVTRVSQGLTKCRLNEFKLITIQRC